MSRVLTKPPHFKSLQFTSVHYCCSENTTRQCDKVAVKNGNKWKGEKKREKCTAIKHRKCKRAATQQQYNLTILYGRTTSADCTYNVHSVQCSVQCTMYSVKKSVQSSPYGHQTVHSHNPPVNSPIILKMNLIPKMEN
jgi:lipopolysaccharide biosynthesis glycosyltransferase